jgi:hypothetical protein
MKNLYTHIHFHRSPPNTDQPQAIPTFARAVCKLRPDNAAISSVTPNDIAYWRLNPEELVGKCFVTTEEIMRRTYLIQDYYVKHVGGPRYEVVFEDTGLDDVDTLEVDELLDMIEDSQLFVTDSTTTVADLTQA